MNTQVEARRLEEMQPDSCSHALLPEEARCQLLPLTPAVASFPSPTPPRSSKGSGVSPGSGLSVVAGAPTFAVQKPGFRASRVAAGKPPRLNPQKTGEL